jgi:hypothetical protein
MGNYTMPTALIFGDCHLFRPRSGTGLHWPDLDEDLSVIGIIEGRFGTP